MQKISNINFLKRENQRLRDELRRLSNIKKKDDIQDQFANRLTKIRSIKKSNRDSHHRLKIDLNNIGQTTPIKRLMEHNAIDESERHSAQKSGCSQRSKYSRHSQSKNTLNRKVSPLMNLNMNPTGRVDDEKRWHKMQSSKRFSSQTEEFPSKDCLIENQVGSLKRRKREIYQTQQKFQTLRFAKQSIGEQEQKRRKLRNTAYLND